MSAVERKRVGFFTDTSVCIGCKACEVACKEWNEVPEDGYLLTGLNFDEKELPTLVGAEATGPRLDEHSAEQTAILGATPAPLRDRLQRSSWDEDYGGIVVHLRGAPELRFGDGSRAEDKWKAAVAVLSSEERGSPSYLDVSVPDRPVSGG